MVFLKRKKKGDEKEEELREKLLEKNIDDLKKIEEGEELEEKEE